TKEIKKFIEDGIDALKDSGFWANIPYNFQATLMSSIRCQNTILSDLGFILKAIEENKLTNREVELMKKVGMNEIEYNGEYGETYKEEHNWKAYGNKDFKLVEELYGNGRDYFVTMQDAVNVSVRLRDYINVVPNVVNQNITQTVNGNKNTVNGINNGTIINYEINATQFTSDIDSVLRKLKDIRDVDPEHKAFIEMILKESKEAVENGDLEAQTSSKSKMKGFLMGASDKAITLVNLLGGYSSIASYFGL